MNPVKIETGANIKFMEIIPPKYSAIYKWITHFTKRRDGVENVERNGKPLKISLKNQY